MATRTVTREEITNIIPILKEILINETPLFTKQIVERLQDRCNRENISYRATEVTLRQMINYLRSNTILPVIADVNGYRLAKSQEEIVVQAQSLLDRARSIESAANGLVKFTI